MVLLRRLIGEDIQLQTVLTNEPSRVRADQVQLQQILMNLAINARDAMPEGGRLTIEVANLALNETYGTQHFAVQPGPYVMIAVVDTGAGMSDEVQARLFEPFFTPRGAAKEPVSVSRRSTARSSKPAVTSGSTASPATAAPSRSTCHESTRTRQLWKRL